MENGQDEILVIEEQEGLRLVISDLLIADGWKVWAAGRAEEVVPFLGGRKPAAALIDIGLSETTGIQLFEEIKRVCPRLEVVLIADPAFLETAVDALGKEAFGYVRKPLEGPEEMLRLVGEAVEKKRISEEMERLRNELKKKENLLTARTHEFSSLYLLLWQLNQNFIRQNAEVHSLMEQIKTEAIRDTLTGLYNRRFFDSRIEEEMTRAERTGNSLAILLCDLDHFKAINDNLGHQMGDQVLKAVANSIRDSTRGSDLIFRWGGDEFVIVLPGATQKGVVIGADRIRSGVAAIGQKAHLPLDISIGAALYPDHGNTIDGLISLADRALYIAKKGEDKLYIGNQESCIDDHSVKIVFQSIVDVRSNQVIGYEALGRDPEEKLTILNLFKKHQSLGQLHDFKDLCFRLQLKMAEQLQLKKVFINIDFNLLNGTKLSEKPRGMEVVLEISEAEALNNVENYFRLSEKWRKKGFKFAIDDFGAGFISLPFICQLVPDYIKMDRSSILQAVSSEKFRKFLSDLIAGLRNYSKEGIIAEGIETEKELQVIRQMGIDLVQGFLFGKPKTLE